MDTGFNHSDSEKVLDLLREIESNPHVTQRDLARKFGISLGKINFLIKALLQKGIIKATNLKNSKNIAAYFYLLTPEGIHLRFKLTQKFYIRKMREYEQLKKEIELFNKRNIAATESSAVEAEAREP